MPTAKVWRDSKNGQLYHDDCFEEGESREGYIPVKLDELVNEDACESCGGIFLSGLSPVDESDDEDDDDC